MMIPMLMGASSGDVVNPIPLTSVGSDDLFPVPGTTLASFTFGVDGLLTMAGNDSFGGPEWFHPARSGVGVGYWIRVTKTAGVNNTSGQALSTWINITGSMFWTWSQTGMGSKSATLTVELATDSLGTNIVATKTGIPVYVNIAP